MVLTPTLGDFQARWTCISPQTTATDGHASCTLNPRPASPIPPEISPIQSPDVQGMQEPMFIEETVPTVLPSLSCSVFEDVRLNDSGRAPAIEESMRHCTAGIGSFLPSPEIQDAKVALNDLQNMLRPRRKSGPGYVDPKLDMLFSGKLAVWAGKRYSGHRVVPPKALMLYIDN
jgi:hypothetical protein